VKFARVAGGAVERDAGAHEWRATDMRGARVWVHPASVQFSETRWRSGIVVSFERVETATKVFLRDVTEVCRPFPSAFFFFAGRNNFFLRVVRLGPVVCAAFVRWAHHRRSRAWRVDRRRSSRRDVALARMAAHRDPRSTTSVRFPPLSSHIISHRQPLEMLLTWLGFFFLADDC
jgi:hypothetical protein